MFFLNIYLFFIPSAHGASAEKKRATWAARSAVHKKAHATKTRQTVAREDDGNRMTIRRIWCVSVRASKTVCVCVRSING